MGNRRKSDRRRQSAVVAGAADAGPPLLRGVLDLLGDVGPVLDACRDAAGSVDWVAVGQTARARATEIETSLVDQMAPYDAFDIVANMLLYNAPIDPETYRESEHTGQIANVEYAASLCLRRPDRRGTTNDRDPGALGSHMETWNREIKRLLRLRGLGHMASLAGDKGELADVRYEQFERELIVRNPAYEWQEKAHLRGLFRATDVKSDLRRLVGFRIDDGLLLADACMSWIIDALPAGANAALDEVDALRRLVDAQRSDKPLPASPEQTAAIAELAERSDYEIDEMLHAFRMWSAWHALGDRSSFTAAELAAATGTSPTVAANFLVQFSQFFGQEPLRDPMQALQAVRARPIICDGERHHCVDGGALLSGIRTRLEDVLRSDDAWKRYERHRRTWTEQRALDLFAGVLDPDEKHHSLRWTVDDNTYELDGLLLLDRFAITIEVKAGRFSEPARRAAPGRLERDLRKLIFDAHTQARRARDALTAGTDFSNSDGDVSIDSARIQTVLPVVITLDELGVSPRIWELARHGVLQAGELHPTTMALTELELVCDVLDTPSRLIHYLTRRQTFNQIGGVVAMEEADLLMYYMDQGLFVEQEDEPGVTVLPSLTDPLDEYQLYKHGKRKTPSPKPSVLLHPEIETLIDALETARPGGWTATACLMLDLAGDEQHLLGKRIRTMRKRSRRKGVPHDITIAIDDSKRGLTVVIEPHGDHERLADYVRTLSFKNKHMTRAATWSGLGIHATENGAFHFHLHDATPWEPDAELDEAIAAWTETHEGHCSNRKNGGGT